jgi:hypothetical protein
MNAGAGKPCNFLILNLLQKLVIELFQGFWQQPKSIITGIIIKYLKGNV